MPHRSLAREAKRLIDRIAETPRGAGTEGEARARKFCADYLMRAGFAVTEEEFSYSALPGRWAVPLFGLLSLTWFVMMGVAPNRSDPEQTMRAAMTLLALLPLLYIAANQMIRRPRYMLTRARNLIAVRGGAPRAWLVAHLDSKSQPVPMLVRIGGILLASSAMLFTIVSSLITSMYAPGNVLWVPVTVAGAAGSVAVLLSTVGNRSQGAVDNASGVAAAMLTAVNAPEDFPVGVLLTSAEELGLAGAWAWVREQADRHATRQIKRAVNFDGLDDVGTLTCMSDPYNPLNERMRSAASEAGVPLNFRKVLPGIMVDATALARSDWEAVTISKGDFSTLARIHTPSDSPDRLTGEGVAEAVEVVTNFMKGEG
ncbi:MAG TPA: M28 family peptidase [Gemmatimonadaceae bacterium]|nr:M28 family peptidase [Gemmatimonadaceae bacterium]